jgi:hypothetical protein
MTGEFTPTADLIVYRPSSARVGDKYFSRLMVVLLGYAIIGQGFSSSLCMALPSLSMRLSMSRPVADSGYLVLVSDRFWNRIEPVLSL